MKQRTALSVLGALLLLVAGASSAHTEVARVTVSVDGLACPFCTYGIEKKLKKVAGVRDVITDLKSGTATLLVLDGQVPDIGEVKAAIKKAGFTPKAITLTAVGILEVSKEKALLRLRGSDSEFLLFRSGRDPKGALDAKTRELLLGLAERGALVAITGEVHPHVDAAPALSASTVEEVHAVVLEVEGMTCDKCSSRLTKLLSEAKGVYRATVSLAEKRATVESIGEAIEAATLIGVVKDAGFKATVSSRGNDS